MKGHNDFIVHIPKKYQDTITTKGGAEIHLDRRFSGKELANNVFEVIHTPVTYNGDIKPGYRLLVDPIVVHTQKFQKWGEEENQYLVDKEKDLYRINTSLIVCYSQGEGTKFVGFENNLICKKVKIESAEKELKKVGSIFVPDMSKAQAKDTAYLEILIGNDKLKKEDIHEGDYVYHTKHGGIDITINQKTYIWFRNHHIIGKHVKQSA
jgi:co-chaperonin GroES (HSP10)